MNINDINSSHKILIATTKNIFVVINHNAMTIITGKLRNIIKLNITLMFRNNIRKYNLKVLFKFNIVILVDIQIASNTFLFSMIIIYLEYASIILTIIHKKSNPTNI